ncbi:MAG: type VI secretion system ATPase TssH [Succinivibrionaceae bacterium]|nr:type VI secretion system ATPase TssH [Succinivibrionaceae bacterium]
MIKFKRNQLFGRLDAIAYKALESATVLCKTRGNPYVDLSHFINQLLMGQQNDLHEIVRHFGIDESKLSRDLTAALDRLQRGALAISDFSPTLEVMVKEAWMIASLMFGNRNIRVGHLILALKLNENIRRDLHDISGEFVKVNGDLLQEQFATILKNSQESAAPITPDSSSGGSTGQAEKMMSDPAMGKGEALARYTVDLTAKAKEGKGDHIVGRDEEIRKMMDILLRRRQNNPILTGEAGVGKTAVVEGFAERLASGDVPDALKGTTLRSLDIGLLQAGASMKGEFENRLKSVIEEVQNSDTPIILFIDEAHTLIGAGGAAGQNDAANLLKPALARGQLRCIAATTYQEYIKYFEKDPALTRRFENILVQEPDDEKAVEMLRGMVGMLEKHHKVKIMDEALETTVKLSRRYIPTRQLPDKGVSILDTACAKVALSQNAEPANLEFTRRKIEAMKLEISILEKEQKEGFDHSELLTELHEKLGRLEAEEKRLSEKLAKTREMAQAYLKLREESAADEAVAEQNRGELKRLREELEEFQGEEVMFLPEVDAQAVSSVISEWTGIPLGRMVRNEIEGVLNLASAMKERVAGQDHALDLIAKRITTARASLADPNRPIAVLMLAGPSGVGKTETALTLATQMYGSENNLITINMSEFQESHTVSTLKGAPPGYVGYGEGGVLTEAVRKRPYSVVLLDEVEKAHKDVHELFFQVFDKGRMEDGSGRLINFRNTVIILTTNVGDDAIMRLCQDEDNYPDTKVLEEAVRPAMERVFPQALLGRLSIIPFFPLGKKVLRSIIDLKLAKIVKRVKENYRATFTYTENVRDEIIKRCNNVASGARLIDAIINNDLLPEVSAEFLRNTMEGKEMTEVTADVADGKFTFDFKFKEVE